LGAAAYGLKAAHAAAPEGVGDSAGQLECLWQRPAPGGDSRARPRRPAVAQTTSAGQCLTAESGVRAPALPSKRRLLTEVMRSADGRSEPPPEGDRGEPDCCGR